MTVTSSEIGIDSIAIMVVCTFIRKAASTITTMMMASRSTCLTVPIESLTRSAWL